jgi:hypothetical protein
LYAVSTDLLGMTPTRLRAGGSGIAIRFAVGETSLGAILLFERPNRASHAILTSLERQRLKRLRCKPAPLPVTVLYPHRQHLSRRLQAFIEWAATLLTVEMRLTSPTA